MVVPYDVGFGCVDARVRKGVIHSLARGLEDLCLGDGAMGLEVFLAPARECGVVCCAWRILAKVRWSIEILLSYAKKFERNRKSWTSSVKSASLWFTAVEMPSSSTSPIIDQ